MKQLLITLAALLLVGCQNLPSGNGGGTDNGTNPEITGDTMNDETTGDTMNDETTGDAMNDEMAGDTMNDEMMEGVGMTLDAGNGEIVDTFAGSRVYENTKCALLGGDEIPCPSPYAKPYTTPYTLVLFVSDGSTVCIGKDHPRSVVECEFETAGDVAIYDNTVCRTDGGNVACPERWEGFGLSENQVCYIGDEVVECPTTILYPHSDHYDVITNPMTIYSATSCAVILLGEVTTISCPTEVDEPTLVSTLGDILGDINIYENTICYDSGALMSCPVTPEDMEDYILLYPHGDHQDVIDKSSPEDLEMYCASTSSTGTHITMETCPADHIPAYDAHEYVL